MEVPYMIIQPTQTLSKIALTASMLLLCVILVGRSTDSSPPGVYSVSPMEKDSMIINKLEKKLEEYELTRKSK